MHNLFPILVSILIGLLGWLGNNIYETNHRLATVEAIIIDRAEVIERLVLLEYQMKAVTHDSL